MESTAIGVLSEMANHLTTLTVKGTVAAIHSKIESVKHKNTNQNTYQRCHFR